MLEKRRGCQALPDAARGVVVGVDVSKGKMTFGAYRPGEQSKVYFVDQDKAGYRKFKVVLDNLRNSGYDPWVAFEPTGPYSTCLRERLLRMEEHVVQVNGYHVKRTKEVRDNSPGKSDCKDPRVIGDLVWQGCYQQVNEMPEAYIELRCESSEWASLSKQRARVRNEFQGLLEVWFPELRNIFRDPLCNSARALVRHYGSVTEIVGADIASIRSILRDASCGTTVKRAEEIQKASRESISPHEGQRGRHRAMVAQLDMLEMVEARQYSLYQEMIEGLKDVPEADPMLSLGGIGIITVSGILGGSGPISMYATYGQIEKFVGLNIYEASSGRWTGEKHISKRGQAQVRYLLCQAAVQQIRKNGLFREYADELKAKGKKAGQIRVAVARKLLKIIYAMARDGRAFDPNRFRATGGMEHGQLTHQGTPMKAA